MSIAIEKTGRRRRRTRRIRGITEGAEKDREREVEWRRRREGRGQAEQGWVSFWPTWPNSTCFFCDAYLDFLANSLHLLVQSNLLHLSQLIWRAWKKIQGTPWNCFFLAVLEKTPLSIITQLFSQDDQHVGCTCCISVHLECLDTLMLHCLHGKSNWFWLFPAWCDGILRFTSSMKCKKNRKSYEKVPANRAHCSTVVASKIISA